MLKVALWVAVRFSDKDRCRAKNHGKFADA
ncbi:MAG: hypothetical protein RL598_1337, partial [Verrucomicrobiota bacterium]